MQIYSYKKNLSLIMSFEFCPRTKIDRTDKKELKYSYVDFRNEKLKNIFLAHKVRGEGEGIFVKSSGHRYVNPGKH